MCDCDWFNDLDTWKKWVVVFIPVVLIISCFLIGFSVTVLVPLNYGLLKDNNAVEIETDELYESGRHFLGLGFSFVEFPRTIQYLTFSDSLLKDESDVEEDVRELSDGVAAEAGSSEYNDLSKKFSTITARTKEGLKMYLDMYIGYKVTTSNDESGKVSQLNNIYSNFGYEWNKFLSLITNAVVRDTMMEFEALNIPQSRETIGNKLFENLKKLIYDFHFELIQLNVVNIQFPKEIDESITKTEIVNQTKQKMDFVKVITETEAETNLQLAQLETKIIKSKADIEGYEYLIDKATLASLQEEQIRTYAETMKVISDNLGFDNTGSTIAAKCLDFLWIYGMKENEANRVVIETKRPTLS